jgi:hypothetical protein
MHVDLNSSGGNGLPFDEQKRRVDAEVARLMTLGATDERGPMERDGESWCG